MARLTFPSDRLVYQESPRRGSVFTSAADSIATVYSDAAGTVLADVQDFDGTANAAATFTVDSTSRLPLWLGPADGTDTLYVKVGTGPVTAVYAVTSGDISAAVGTEVANRSAADAAHVAASDPHGDRAAAAADATTKANAAQAAAIAASAQRASNLSDLASATTARTNLGLGTAATQASSAFDAAGAATAAQAAAIAASAQRASNLSDLANAATARTNLGLGTAATQASTAFDASGAAAAAQSAAQSFATSAVATQHTADNASYVARQIGQSRRGAVQEIAVPSGALVFANVPKGVYAKADSVGVDGAVYSHASSTQVLRSTDSLQASFPAVLIDLAGVTGYTAGDGIVYCTSTSEGFVAVTTNGDTGKIWFTAVAAGTSGWQVVQTTRAIQKQAIAKPAPGPDGKTLLLLGEYGSVTNTVARNLWLSRDGGLTWAAIAQTKLVNTAVNTHCHGSAYDPVRRRIWSSQGDGANAWFGYSDDFGKTWVDLPLTSMAGSVAIAGYPSPNTYQQPVAVVVLGERVIGTPDGQSVSGVWDMDPDSGFPTQAFALPSGETAFQQFGFTASDGHRRGRELYLAFPDTSSGTLKTYIVGTGDYGRSWWLLGTLTSSATPALGPLVGPDKNGWLYYNTVNDLTLGTNLNQAAIPTWTWSTAGN